MALSVVTDTFDSPLAPTGMAGIGNMIFYGSLRLGKALVRIASTALILLALAVHPILAEAGDDGRSQEIIERYVESLPAQSEAMRGMAVDVTVDGKLPKLKKEGKMSLLRLVSRIGQITYKQINFWGDDTVKKEVIARYLTAEQAQGKEAGNVSITPVNYNFKYKGVQDRNSRRVHVFELKPKQKRVGLFKGELWLDQTTCLPVRESGKFVKNPSIFLKKVEFTREYEIDDGFARPKHIQSVIDTRIAGKAELDIDFSNYRKAPAVPVDEARNTQ